MRQIKDGEYKNAICFVCCNAAKWRSMCFSTNKYACNDHRNDLKTMEDISGDDGHMSEADEQTWGRI